VVAGNLSDRSNDATVGGEQMTYREDHHSHDSPVHEESDGIVGYAAIKYTAIVVIVLAILAFIAWYILPRVS
jgi:hypothetical protein